MAQRKIRQGFKNQAHCLANLKSENGLSAIFLVFVSFGVTATHHVVDEEKNENDYSKVAVGRF